MRSRFVWVALGSSALLGCSGSDHPGAPAEWLALPECPDHDYSTCDTRDASCQDRLLSLAACLFGAAEAPHVPIRVLGEAALRDELEADAARGQDPAELAALPHVEDALVELGLLEAGALTTVGAVSRIVDAIDGVYLDPTRGILLVDRGMPKDSVNTDAVLLHELIHAIQDAEYDIASWRNQQPDTVDASLAVRTVSEGQATFYQFRVQLAMSGVDAERIDLDQVFARFRASLSDAAQKDPSPYLASATTFPYGFGVGLAYHAWQRDGLGYHVRQFAEPPLSTYEAMRQNEAPDAPLVEPSELAPPSLAGDYTLVDQTVLGAFMLELFLTKHDFNVSQARQAALTWRGDQLWIYEGPNGETGWLWDLQLMSPEQAALLAEQARLPTSVTLEARGNRAFVAGGTEAAPEFLLTAGRAFLATAK